MFIVATLGLVELIVTVMRVTLVVSGLEFDVTVVELVSVVTVDDSVIVNVACVVAEVVCIAILVPSPVVAFVVETFVSFIMNVSLAIHDCFCFIFRCSK